MPRPLMRGGHLMDANDFEEQKDAERQARLARFVSGASRLGASSGGSREVQPLDQEDWEPESTRSHDPHTLEASRARLVEALNSRG